VRARAETLAAALVLALSFFAAPASAADCGAAIISTGDTAETVRDRCGVPVQEVTWRVDRLGSAAGPPPSPVPTIAVFRDAEWIFNPGPFHLLTAVRFRDGRVTGAQTLGPGFAEGRRDADRCRAALFEPGEPRISVETLCGPPADRRERTDHRTQTGYGGRERVHVRVETWTYDFGSRYFTRRYVFENGRLFRIETGELGE